MTRTTRSARTGAVVLATIAWLVPAAPVSAAVDGTLVDFSLNEAECTIDITAEVEDAAFYAINLWDDGNFRAGAGANVGAGGTLIVRFSIGGPILQGATGIGVYLENSVAPPPATTTYDSDGSAQLWSEEVGTACSTTSEWNAVVLSAVPTLPWLAAAVLLLLLAGGAARALRRARSPGVVA